MNKDYFYSEVTTVNTKMTKEKLQKEYDTRVTLNSRETGKELTNEYIKIILVKDDYFAVCNIVNSFIYLDNHSIKALNEGKYQLKTNLKWGVIKLNRDKKGHIIPFGETLIIPYLYDEINSSILENIIMKLDDYSNFDNYKSYPRKITLKKFSNKK